MSDLSLGRRFGRLVNDVDNRGRWLGCRAAGEDGEEGAGSFEPPPRRGRGRRRDRDRTPGGLENIEHNVRADDLGPKLLAVDVQQDGARDLRLVILEKWEGPCWDDCIANSTATPARPCLPSCNEERESLAVLRRVRGLNPGVSTMLYLNALLLFPFYELAQRFIDADALLKDVRTGLPVTLKVRSLAGCVGLFFSRPS